MKSPPEQAVKNGSKDAPAPAPAKALTTYPHPKYQDHSEKDLAWAERQKRENEVNAATKSPGGAKETFTMKLHAMLKHVEESGHSSVVRWLSHGRAFKVFDKEQFSKELLPFYFCYQTEFASFQRQLNIYGFMRLNKKGPNHKAYYHELFLRGRPELCTLIPRKRVASYPLRRTFDPKSEPDFSKMVPLSTVARTLDPAKNPNVPVQVSQWNGTKARASTASNDPMQQNPGATGLKTAGLTAMDYATFPMAAAVAPGLSSGVVAGFNPGGFLSASCATSIANHNKSHQHSCHGPVQHHPAATGLKMMGLTATDYATFPTAAAVAPGLSSGVVAGFDPSGFLFASSATSIASNNTSHQHMSHGPVAAGLKMTGLTAMDYATFPMAAAVAPGLSSGFVAGFDPSGFLFASGATSIANNNKSHQHMSHWAASLLSKEELLGLTSSAMPGQDVLMSSAMFRPGDASLNVQANTAAVYNAHHKLIGLSFPAKSYPMCPSNGAKPIANVSQPMSERVMSWPRQDRVVVEQNFSQVLPEGHQQQQVDFLSKPMRKTPRIKHAAAAANVAAADDDSLLDMSQASGAEMANWLEGVDLDTSPDDHNSRPHGRL